jgi:CubicO group peptidase (beta-lactamase class C family)
VTGSTELLVRTVIAASHVATWPHAIAVHSSNGEDIEVCSGVLGTEALTAATPLYAASIAKQVVGVLLARQVVDGVLDPDDALGLYIEDLPAWAMRVRLRHLLHHTSGLTNHVEVASDAGNPEVLEELRRSPELITEPGSTYRYSNVGYICLAEVLSRTSGRPVEQVAADLFATLGMRSARLGGPVRAGLSNQAPPPRTVGDGGLWLSAGDLRRWNEAMNDAALGEAVHVLAETPGVLDDGTALDYAWGVRVFQHKGRRTVSHGGSWPTWSAKTLRQPEAGASVAVLTTSEDADTITAVSLALADQIAT